MKNQTKSKEVISKAAAIQPYKRPDSALKNKSYLKATKCSATKTVGGTKVVGVNLNQMLSNSNSSSKISIQKSPQHSPSFGSNLNSNEGKQKRKKTASNA